jgi:hypothetical protein
MHNLAIRYGETGRRAEALQLAEQVTHLQKIKLGEDHPETLRSMHNLAIQYSETGRRAEALQLAEQVTHLQKIKLGEDHPDTLYSIKLLTYISGETGEHPQRSETAHHSQGRLSMLWQRFRQRGG